MNTIGYTAGNKTAQATSKNAKNTNKTTQAYSLNTDKMVQTSSTATNKSAATQKKITTGAVGSCQRTADSGSTKNNAFYETNLSSLKDYGKSLKASREASKTTTNSLKKLKYNHKDISSKILRSKTSVNARKVVSEAKREILRLKREKQSKKYDSEEIEAAISHAKAMERVAKKKVRHLTEEELCKASSGICADRLTEKEEYEREKEDSAAEGYESEEFEEISDEEYEAMSEDVFEKMDLVESDDWQNEGYSLLDEMMSDTLEEFSDELFENMKDMIAEMGLDDLADSMATKVDDLDPEDLKEMKIKHRNKEMKDIVKADADYLKTMFEHYEKTTSGAGYGAASSIATGGVSESTVSPAVSIDIAL